MADRPIMSGEWQDIGTAPRDSRYLLLYVPTQSNCQIAVGGWYEDNVEQGWYFDLDPFGESLSPTHWQPLPAPPSTTGGQPMTTAETLRAARGILRSLMQGERSTPEHEIGVVVDDRVAIKNAIYFLDDKRDTAVPLIKEALRKLLARQPATEAK